MEKSKNYIIHLATGSYWLQSIETNLRYNEYDDGILEAIEQAVYLAIKNNLSFSYIEDDNIESFIKEQKEYNPDMKNMEDSKILEYNDYYYIDLSHYNLSNIWLDMKNLKVNNNIYNNTYRYDQLK